MMAEKNKTTLELGIGRGGPHNIHDASTLWVGADLRSKNLKRCMDNYGVKGVILDASLTPFISGDRITIPSLPFKDGVFDRAEVRFPHDGLLYGLATSPTGLWTELSRIVRATGEVQVFFDVPKEGFRQIKLGGQRMEIYRPEQGIWQAAVDAGFEVGIKKLSSEQLLKMDTMFSITAFHRMKILEGMAYELNAKRS